MGFIVIVGLSELHWGYDWHGIIEGRNQRTIVSRQKLGRRGGSESVQYGEIRYGGEEDQFFRCFHLNRFLGIKCTFYILLPRFLKVDALQVKLLNPQVPEIGI